MEEEIQKKVQELQFIESNLQNLLMQKQTFQLEINETVNALSELKKTSDDIYKVTGSIMIKADKEKVLSELEEKKTLLETRANSLDKQEELLQSRAKNIQEEVKKEMEKPTK